MSGPIPADDFKLPIAQSDFLDAFNEADLTVRARLIAPKGKPQQLLEPKFDALLKFPAGPQYSRAERDLASKMLSQLSTVLSPNHPKAPVGPAPDQP